MRAILRRRVVGVEVVQIGESSTGPHVAVARIGDQRFAQAVESRATAKPRPTLRALMHLADDGQRPAQSV
jgi:hypothetical protein